MKDKVYSYSLGSSFTIHAKITQVTDRIAEGQIYITGSTFDAPRIKLASKDIYFYTDTYETLKEFIHSNAGQAHIYNLKQEAKKNVATLVSNFFELKD